MSGRHAFRDPLTTVDTYERFTPGTLREYSEIEGYQWTGVKHAGVARYVYNDDTAAFAIGTLVSRDATTVSGGDGIVCPTGLASGVLLGVAQHVIAAGSWGWIMKEGIGEVLADTGGITTNLTLVPGNAVAGRADDRAAVTDDAFAQAHETVAATALATCSIFCR